MHITKIRLENFTVFGKMETDCSAGVNVFIGENGTGKTHLLKLIYTYCEWGFYYHDGPDDEVAPYHMLDEMFQGESCHELIRKSPDGTIARETLLIAFGTGEGEEVYKVELFSNQNRIYDTPKYDAYYSPNHSTVGEKVQSQGEPCSVFIPAKELLTHAGIEKDYMHRKLPLDSTLIEILNKAGVSTLRELPDAMRRIQDRISDIIGGKVIYKNDRYYISNSSGVMNAFAVEAEGFKKFGLVYRLIETGNIKKGSILVWDEPDANLNPKLVPELARILLELSRNGVQIFLATHDYNLMKYISMARNVDDQVMFHSLYKTDDGVVCDRESDYDLLERNPIIDANTKMMEDEIERVL